MKMSVLELAADTGFPEDVVESFVKALYKAKHFDIDEGTVLSISLVLDKKRDFKTYFFINDACGPNDLYEFVTNIRKGTMNHAMLGSLDDLINRSGSKVKEMRDDLFPNGIMEEQPLIHPLLTLMEK